MRERGKFEQLIALRIELLLEKAGTNPRQAALDLGRKQHDLYRRLRPEYAEARPLRWHDVDEVCGLLGVPLGAIMAPVLRPLDAAVLHFVAERVACSAVLVTDAYADPESSLSALEAQGLITNDPTLATVAITKAGREALEVA